ncbi:MAG: radical SAM protein [Candidatus Melainabacteria bacterium]|nr:radical SAM protein [Candidatus Melainabacteria bacterium]
MAIRDPLKIPSMLRLKLFSTDDWQKDYSNGHIDVAPPAVVAVRLNYSCNLRCVMCNQWGENGVFIKTPERMVKREMTLDHWKGLIDDIAKFQPYIYFTGGEPLMNKDIIEIVRYASSKHLITSMSTNSTYLKEKAEDLIEAGLDYLYTSLDAPIPVEEGVIRKFASGDDSAAEAVEAIKYFIELRNKIGKGLPVVQTQTVIVKENHKKLLDMAHFVNDYLKPDVWGLQLCVYTTPELNDATTQSYKKNFNQDQVGWAGFIRDFPDMDFMELKRQLGTIMNTKWQFKLRPYKPLRMDGFDLERYFTRPDEEDTSEVLTCMNPYVFAQLQPNGDIAFCGSQPDYVIGNVKDAPFMELWCNEKATKWREFLKKELFASCKRCFSLHEFSHFRKN